MTTVEVMMSTYNGEHYVREQIETILSQDLVKVNLVIRDDGSTDRTVQIVSDYNDYSEVRFIKGENIGVGRSFWELLKSSGEADFYAFSDQDDIWHRDKLIRAIKMINKEDQMIPILYGCNQNCVDGDGRFLYKRFPDNYHLPKKEECLFRNDISGCTMVFNKQLRDLLITHLPDEQLFELQIHDIWISEVASFVGKTVFDNHAMMDFRRHGNNFSQEAISETRRKNKIKLLLEKVKRLKNGQMKRGGIRKAAEQLLLLYDNYLSESERANLSLIRDYRKSIKDKIRLINSDVFNSYISENKILFKIKVIMNIL